MRRQAAITARQYATTPVCLYVLSYHSGLIQRPGYSLVLYTEQTTLYPMAMNRNTSWPAVIRFALLCLLFGLATTLHAADTPPADNPVYEDPARDGEPEGSRIDPDYLFKLKAVGVFADSIKVLNTKGPGETEPVARSPRWRVMPGPSISQPPSSFAPITVELHGYVNNSKKPKLITHVMVRYFQVAANEWRPMYQLYQEPLMLKTPNGPQPMFNIPEAPEYLTNLTPHSISYNGYFPGLDFRLQPGRTVVFNSWVVK